MNLLSIPTLAAIYAALKESGHWYIVYVGPWSRGDVYIDDCLAIAFDGSPHCKFSVLPDDTLLVRQISSTYFLKTNKFAKLGQIISVNQLITGIRKFPYDPYAKGLESFVNANYQLELDKAIRLVELSLERNGQKHHYNKVSRVPSIVDSTA